MEQENIWSNWQRVADQELAQAEYARARWERDSGWNQTQAALEKHTTATERNGHAVEDWHREHRVQSFLIEGGFRKQPADL